MRILICLDQHERYKCRTYRLSQQVKPLIWVECQVEKHSRSRTEYFVKARSQFKERSTATSVEIMLPLPPDAISPVFKTSQVCQSNILNFDAKELIVSLFTTNVLLLSRVARYMHQNMTPSSGKSRTSQVAGTSLYAVNLVFHL